MNKYFYTLIMLVLFSSMTQILLKSSANKKQSLIKTFFNLRVIISYSILLVITLINAAIIYDNLSLIYINLAETFSYIFVPILSVIFLKEHLNKKVLLGTILIIFGVIVCII